MNQNSLYRAIWRWHFYAGLFVLPVLALMAITGGLYLYKTEIERVVYGQWLDRQYTGDPLSLSEMTQAVASQTGGRVTGIDHPGNTTSSWRMTIEKPDGERRTVFVDPAFGMVMGNIPEGGIMKTVKQLHSLAITGRIGNAVVEIVAGWTILLVATGFYLWWPRNRQPVIAVRGSPKKRLFWRDIHASTGAIAGAFILFLAISGMPWSIFWGAELHKVAASVNGTRPAAPGKTAGGHDHHEEHLPWTMRGLVHPVGGHSHADIGPDKAITIARARGIGTTWSLKFPAKPGDPYLIMPKVVQADQARILYLDATNATVLQDVSYRDFGKFSQITEWGIAVHEGEEYGEPNRLVMLFACIATILLTISAPILWWKRRKSGALSAPPKAQDPVRIRRVAIIMLALGVVFPLTGLTMVAALMGEKIWKQLRINRSRFAT